MGPEPSYPMGATQPQCPTASAPCLTRAGGAVRLLLGFAMHEIWTEESVLINTSLKSCYRNPVPATLEQF